MPSPTQRCPTRRLSRSTRLHLVSSASCSGATSPTQTVHHIGANHPRISRQSPLYSPANLPRPQLDLNDGVGIRAALLDAKAPDGTTLLHVAARAGNAALLAVLLPHVTSGQLLTVRRTAGNSICWVRAGGPKRGESEGRSQVGRLRGDPKRGDPRGD